GVGRSGIERGGGNRRGGGGRCGRALPRHHGKCVLGLRTAPPRRGYRGPGRLRRKTLPRPRRRRGRTRRRPGGTRAPGVAPPRRVARAEGGRMSGDALHFERLVVRRMPGVGDGGFRLEELAPGVNVVHGPNASGKTTTARAIEALLWPRAAAPERASVAGWFRVADDEWMVETEAGRARWQRGGADASAPPLPPAESRDRYRLSLHELLSAEDRALAEEILRESAGGYDLARAAAAIGARSAPSRPNKELNAVKAARQKATDARKRHEELRHEESELAS